MEVKEQPPKHFSSREEVLEHFPELARFFNCHDVLEAHFTVGHVNVIGSDEEAVVQEYHFTD